MWRYFLSSGTGYSRTSTVPDHYVPVRKMHLDRAATLAYEMGQVILDSFFPKPNFLAPGLGSPLARRLGRRSLGPSAPPILYTTPLHSLPRSLRSPLLMIGGRQQSLVGALSGEGHPLCAQSVPARGVHTQDGDGGRSDEGRAAEVASKHVEHVVAER